MTNRRLRAVFARPEPTTRVLPIRHTSAGVWVPTPVPVIERACRQLERLELLGQAAPPGHLVDAGTGDGRIAMFLSDTDPGRRVVGIEQDPTLYARAVEHLDLLQDRGLADPSRVRLIAGDYCDRATYAAAQLDLRQVSLVCNYPDGNQTSLARFVRDQAGPAAKLCLLTHDRTLEIEELNLDSRHDVPADDETVWCLSVYTKSGPS